MRGVWRIGVVVISAAALLGIGVCGVLTTFQDTPDLVGTTWDEHRERCLRSPDDSYLVDRSRAVRGTVRGPDAKPVADATVRCVRVMSLLKLAGAGTPTPAYWSKLVEIETRTDAAGQYVFANLAVGCRMMCVSAPGLAPSTQSLILTQDGSGGRIDFDLEAPKVLRVRFATPAVHPCRVHLVPHRWWPELPVRDLALGQEEVEFTGVGGTFDKGLVVISDLGGRPGMTPVAAFDASRRGDVLVASRVGYTVAWGDVPEVGDIPPWRAGVSEAARTFFSLLSPVALFWQTGPESTPTTPTRAPRGAVAGAMTAEALALPAAAQVQHGGEAHTAPGPGTLRGYGPDAFLPVLIESGAGQAWVEWTSEASEFELAGAPAGVYRVRALAAFGRMTFARGLVVTPGVTASLKTRLGAVVQTEKPTSREVMGVVRWEDGRPGEGAVVFLQDATDFRRFLKRVVADGNGFFTVPEVPASAYVAFALPPGEERAMKRFVFPVVGDAPRETWLDFTLSPHRVVGRAPGGATARALNLLKLGPNGEESAVWRVHPTEDGRFEIANVPHGRYAMRETGAGVSAGVSSRPFAVAGEVVVTVRWPE